MEGTLAADSLIQAPRRTSGAVAALMLSIALVISLGGVSRASYASIVRWLNTALNPDLFVSSSETMVTHTVRFPASVGDELRRVPGVEEVQAVRDARILFRGTPILLIAVDTEGLERRAKAPAIQGDNNRMYRLASEGKGVIIADNLALLHHLR